MIYFVVFSICAASVYGQFDLPVAEPPPASALQPIIGDKLVAFASDFVQAVQRPGRLQGILTAAINEIKEAPESFYNVIHDAAVLYENPFPDELSKVYVDAITSVKDILTAVSLGKILATSTGRELIDHGHLTSIADALELSRSFTNYMNEAVVQLGEEVKPGDNTRALTMGVFRFFKSLNLISPGLAISYVYYLIGEYYALRIYS